MCCERKRVCADAGPQAHFELYLLHGQIRYRLDLLRRDLGWNWQSRSLGIEDFAQAAIYRTIWDGAYAQYALGKLYLLGKQVPPDHDAAVRWLEQSAAQGNEVCPRNAGMDGTSPQPLCAVGGYPAPAPHEQDLPGAVGQRLYCLDPVHRQQTAPAHPGEEDRHGPQAG